MIEIEVEAGEAEQAAKEGTLNIQGLRRRIWQAEWAIERIKQPGMVLALRADLAKDRERLSWLEAVCPTA